MQDPEDFHLGEGENAAHYRTCSACKRIGHIVDEFSKDGYLDVCDDCIDSRMKALRDIQEREQARAEFAGE